MSLFTLYFYDLIVYLAQMLNKVQSCVTENWKPDEEVRISPGRGQETPDRVNCPWPWDYLPLRDGDPTVQLHGSSEKGIQ